MFDFLLLIKNLILTTCYTFFLLFLFRHLLIKRKVSIIGYHVMLFLVFFFAIVGGDGVVSDGYARLKKFTQLEQHNQLDDAKRNPKNDDPALGIDLQEFKDSDQFRAYLSEHSNYLRKFEAGSVGWFFVLLSDLAMVVVGILRYLANRIRNRFSLGRT